MSVAAPVPSERGGWQLAVAAPPAQRAAAARLPWRLSRAPPVKQLTQTSSKSGIPGSGLRKNSSTSGLPVSGRGTRTVTAPVGHLTTAQLAERTGIPPGRSAGGAARRGRSLDRRPAVIRTGSPTLRPGRDPVSSGRTRELIMARRNLGPDHLAAPRRRPSPVDRQGGHDVQAAPRLGHVVRITARAGRARCRTPPPIPRRGPGPAAGPPASRPLGNLHRVGDELGDDRLPCRRIVRSVPIARATLERLRGLSGATSCRPPATGAADPGENAAGSPPRPAVARPGRADSLVHQSLSVRAAKAFRFVHREVFRRRAVEWRCCLFGGVWRR